MLVAKRIQRIEKSVELITATLKEIKGCGNWEEQLDKIDNLRWQSKRLSSRVKDLNLEVQNNFDIASLRPVGIGAEF